MIRIKDTRHPHTASFLSSAVRTAEYYGFQPVESQKRMRLPTHAPMRGESELQFARRDERTLLSAARVCVACERPPQGTLLLWRIVKVSGPQGQGNALELHCVGAPQAFAEALLIIVAHAIADDAQLTTHTLSINSIGSFESSNRYVRDVSSFLRKNLESIAPSLRTRAATDPLGTLIQLYEKGHPATPRAPQATEYLTEDERKRFWDLLEYLEVFGISYELSAHVLGGRDIWAHTLYELTFDDAESGVRTPFAYGGRYDPLASRLAGIHTPAATITIVCETRGKSAHKPETKPEPSLYFAHLGAEARRRAFRVLEILRRAQIPVHQSIMHERLGDQMDHAKRTQAAFLILMGHKEAVEGTVLVREVATNAQEAIPVDELPSYLRRRKLALPALA
jgi:histidyl-tRNA synthetase